MATINNHEVYLCPLSDDAKRRVQDALKPWGVTFPTGSKEVYPSGEEVVYVGFDNHNSNGILSERIRENIHRVFPDVSRIYCNGVRV